MNLNNLVKSMDIQKNRDREKADTILKKKN